MTDMRSKFNEEMLKAIQQRDKCQFIQPHPKLNAFAVVQFFCKCGQQGSKQLRHVPASGAYCDNCTKERTAQKIKGNLKNEAKLVVTKEILRQKYQLLIECYGASDPLIVSHDEMLTLTIRPMCLTPNVVTPNKTGTQYWAVRYFTFPQLESRVKNFRVSHNDDRAEQAAREFAKECKSKFERSSTLTVSKPVHEIFDRLEFFKKRFGISAKILEYADVQVPLEPYFLGLWLGDGTQSIPDITTVDSEIIHYLKKYCERLGLRLTNQNRSGITFKMTGQMNRSNVVTTHLRSLKLIEEKHIPDLYLENSREVRMSVLAGLLDSDGGIRKEGVSFQICQSRKHERLFDDIMRLVNSLGFLMTKTYYMSSLRQNDVLKEYPSIRGSIRGWGNQLSEIPVLLRRKILSTKQVIRRDLSKFDIKVN